MELVFEIGTEELPASFQKPALAWMQETLLAGLLEARLLVTPLLVQIDGQEPRAGEAGRDGGLDFIHTYATPRRLAITVGGINAKAPDVVKQVQGPPVKTAFGPDGKPTKAAEGFAKKLGVPVSALRPDENNERVVVEQELRGQTAREALPPLLDKLASQIPFRKAMRWGDGAQAFARPMHWLAATLDGQPLPVAYADVKSAPKSFGHRFHSPGDFPLPSAADYVDTLRNHHVLADWEERKARILAEVQRAAREAGPSAEPLPDDELLETVTGLVEEPTGVLGTFEARFLELPPEVLVSEMKGHQKYFAVRDGQTKKLLPAFVAVSNTKVKDPAVSRRGYERVLRARLSDGRFFFDEDRKVTLQSRDARLARITFFQGLGTQLERVQRLRELSRRLLGEIGGAGVDGPALDEAASLCKSDLTSGMVGEFPELQGIMGATYARLEGRPAAVSEAIEQHYWPKSAEGEIPSRLEGTLLALADRLDQLVGFFGVGKRPTGTADPYALRRAAIGILRLVLETRAPTKDGRLRLDLKKALELAQAAHGAQAASGNKVAQGPQLVDELWQFLVGRIEVLWKDRAPADAIAAALGTGATDVVLLEKKLDALVAERTAQPERFAAAAGAFKRIGNILLQAAEKKLAPAPFQAALARLEAEQQLAEAVKSSSAAAAFLREDYTAAWAELARLRPAVDKFFDDVMVMDPDPGIRDNRLALLAQVHGLFAPLCAFGKLQTA
jgi:glycyl-tRNA synthetase beta chain